MPVVIDGSTGVTTPGVTNSGTDSAAIQTYGGVAMPRMVLSTAQNTTSGTAIDFTGIPSWVKRITVMFYNVSTSGTSAVIIQLGSGSFTTTGYLGSASNAASGAAWTIGNFTAGLPTSVDSDAGRVRQGSTVIANVTGNNWIATTSLSNSNAASYSVGAGSIGLGGALDRLRITTVSGADTFDAGSVNILYEG